MARWEGDTTVAQPPVELSQASSSDFSTLPLHLWKASSTFNLLLVFPCRNPLGLIGVNHLGGQQLRRLSLQYLDSVYVPWWARVLTTLGIQDGEPHNLVYSASWRMQKLWSTVAKIFFGQHKYHLQI